MARYKKKPVVIEAEQFTDENKDRCVNFVTCNCFPDFSGDGQPELKIQTLEGEMTASVGDFIIKGVNGEPYPCKPDIFAKTYNPLVEKEFPAHQQRVVAEKVELDEKIEKLKCFILDQKSLFKTLSSSQQGILVLQSQTMNSYSLILGMRIDAF